MITKAPEGIHGQRVRPVKGHEPIRREALQDERLSFKATGILGYLLSLPDNWRTDADRLSKAKNGGGRAKEGRESIQAGLRELEDAGYLVRRKYQNEHGKWQWTWKYADDPSHLDEFRVSAGQTVNGLPGDGSTGDGLPGDIEVQEVEVLDVKKNQTSRERSKPSSDADATSGADDHRPVPGRGSRQEPRRPRASATSSRPDPDSGGSTRRDHVAVETNNSAADDLGGQLVMLDGTAAPPAKKTGKRGGPPTQERNARDVVRAWVDAYRTTGNEPLPRRCAQVGKEAKELLAHGYDVNRVIDAATGAGKQGWFSLERQLTAPARTANHRAPNRIRDFRSPEDQSVYDQAW